MPKTEVNMDNIGYRQSKHTSIGADFHFQMSNTDRPWYWLLKNVGYFGCIKCMWFHTGRWAGNLAEKSQRGQSSEADGHGSEWCAFWALGRSERSKTSAGGFSISIYYLISFYLAHYHSFLIQSSFFELLPQSHSPYSVCDCSYAITGFEESTKVQPLCYV